MTFLQFAGDEQRLDGLARAHVVGDEQAHRFEAQRHEQRHELVGARADRDAPQRAQWCGALAQGRARRLPAQMGTERIGEVLQPGWGKVAGCGRSAGRG